MTEIKTARDQVVMGSPGVKQSRKERKSPAPMHGKQ